MVNIMHGIPNVASFDGTKAVVNTRLRHMGPFVFITLSLRSKSYLDRRWNPSFHVGVDSCPAFSAPFIVAILVNRLLFNPAFPCIATALLLRLAADPDSRVQSISFLFNDFIAINCAASIIVVNDFLSLSISSPLAAMHRVYPSSPGVAVEVMVCLVTWGVTWRN